MASQLPGGKLYDAPKKELGTTHCLCVGAADHCHSRTADDLPSRIRHLLRHDSAEQFRGRAGAESDWPDRGFYDCALRADSIRCGRADLRHWRPATSLQHHQHRSQSQDSEYDALEFQRAAGTGSESCVADRLCRQPKHPPAAVSGYQSAAARRGIRAPAGGSDPTSQCEQVARPFFAQFPDLCADQHDFVRRDSPHTTLCK